jgi:hypothetical protein
MLLYLPQWADLVPVLITWLVGAVLLLLGTALSRRAAPEFRIGAGWGALCLVLTAWGVFLPWSLRIPAAALAVMALAAQLMPSRRLRRDDWRAVGRLLLVTLPLWAVMAPVRPSQIDTFLNLLPNVLYLVDYGRLPTAWRPPSYSWFPAAPYNTQFLAFLGSLLDRDYPAPGMSLINVMLRLVAGLALARLLARTADAVPPWRWVALGMLLVTLLDPGFVPRFHFSAYGENALAVTALLAACLFLEGERRLELSLILAAMINTKQSGIGLVLAVAGAAVAADLMERRTRLRPLLQDTAIALLPAALLYAVWRYHATRAGVAELQPLAFGMWNWSSLPATVGSIVDAILEKPVYFAAVGVVFAGFPWLLRRRGWSPATRFAAFFAAAFILYNGFLLATYVVHFSPDMSAEAHSYFRYNTHLSLLLVAALALAVRELVPSPRAILHVRGAGAFAVVLALLAPVAFAERLRFDIAMPQPLVWNLANELRPYLKNGDRLALLAPDDDGDVGRLLANYLATVPPRRRRLAILHHEDPTPQTLDQFASAGYDLAVITCTQQGLYGLPPEVAVLLWHDADGWHQVAAWSHAAGIPVSRWARSRHWPALCR